MNIFVLSTGRCGSMTLDKFCKHITNYTSAHESRNNLDFKYSPNHIEIDNRLSWFLGRLDKIYGDEAFYVHLKRDDLKVAKSYQNRFYYKRGIALGYKYNLLSTKARNTQSDFNIMVDYCKTVNANISLFLKDKSNFCIIETENFKDGAVKFWDLINAQGNLESALKEFDIKYNPSNTSIIKKIKNIINR